LSRCICTEAIFKRQELEPISTAANVGIYFTFPKPENQPSQARYIAMLLNLIHPDRYSSGLLKGS
jgi:hypothetical protein